VVKSLNGLQDDLNLIGGDNVTITPGDATAINIAVTQPVVAYGISGATTTIGPDWTNYENCSVTLACPGPGTVIINSTVWMRINHTQNTLDRVEVCNSESPTSNTSGPPYWASYEIPASFPTAAASMDITLPIQTVFSVTAEDSVTYYLNGRMVNGQDALDVFFYANIVATWYPASQVTTSSVPMLPSDIKQR
jgi:hypothetical protein